LTRVGYAVVSTNNVDDACRLAIDTSPTLVVTDLRIGLHDTRLIPIELRRIAALQRTPMVVSSAWDLPQDRAPADLVDAELFTTTPVDFLAIKELAAKLIRRPNQFVAD
jgi:CheY-like chemotaxis protein